jgi:hypothetical protein
MALKGAPDGSQFNLDTLFPIAESLVPTIFQQVALSYVGDPQAESLLTKDAHGCDDEVARHFTRRSPDEL